VGSDLPAPHPTNENTIAVPNEIAANFPINFFIMLDSSLWIV